MAEFQRSYTMNLKPATPDISEQDKFTLWNRLFITHWSVNEGAKIFGELFLNLRGGLSPQLDSINLNKVKDDKKKKALVMGRRRLLALGWLSVEDSLSAGKHPYRINEIPIGGNMEKSQAIRLLSEILKNKGIQDKSVIKEWIEDCIPSLIANVREDAVWINRASSFNSIEPSPTKDETWKILSYVLSTSFLDLSLNDSSERENKKNNKESKENKKDASNKSKELYGWFFTKDPNKMRETGENKDRFINKFRETFNTFTDYPNLKDEIELWRKNNISNTLLINKKAKYPPEVKEANNPSKFSRRYRKLLVHLGLWPSSKDENGDIPTGINGKDKSSNQILLDYLLDVCNEGDKASKKVITPAWANTIKTELESKAKIRVDDSTSSELKRLMIKMAARRISQTLSWIKINEQERHDAYMEKKEALDSLSDIDKEGEAIKWLENYERFRTEESGGEEYHISKSAIQCWEQILDRWNQIDSSNVLVEKIKEVQAEAEKFGDARLFIDLADINATSVWIDPDGNKTPKILKQWNKYRTAEINESRFKIPCYCHPHPFRHPVYIEYGNSNPKVIFNLKEANMGGESQNLRGIALLLLDNIKQKSTLAPLIWESKRLWKDLGGDATVTDKIPRSDRMGLSSIGRKDSVKPETPFLKKIWNARLQCDRRTLEKLEKYWIPESMNWSDDGKFLIKSKWFITFGPDMGSAKGPWKRFIEENKVDKIFLTNRNNENQKRGSRAKKILSGYPSGMRILSVDLGHRYAASCAVWVTLTKEQIIQESSKQPDRNSIFVYSTKKVNDKIKNTVYRRIGNDSIPAPWAKLEKQFSIKLQGEDEPCRLSTPAEVKLFQSISNNMNCLVNGAGKNILDLIENMLKIAKYGIYRQGVLARIAYSMTAQYKPGKGGQKIQLDKEGKIRYLSENLASWSNLLGNKEWNEEAVSDCYNTYISHFVSGPKPKEGKRKNDKDKLIEYYLPVARKLYDDENTRKSIHKILKELWTTNNTQLLAALKEIKKIIIPKGIRHYAENTDSSSRLKKNNNNNITHQGGLSLRRIVAIEDYYKLSKAYKNRPEPDDLTKNIPLPGDNSLTGYNQKIRDTLERLKEQRVKQLASRIIESALGLGIEGYKKRLQTIQSKPCQAIVIEDLKNYRPDELQTRRENRRLMQWSSSKVKKYLSEACEMHDVRLFEVLPNYTSRQDSRTGAPGIRCQDVNIREFLDNSSRWQNQIKTIQKKPENKRTLLDHYFIDLNSKLTETYKGKEIPSDKSIRIPRRGGDIFVSSSEKSPVIKGIQADLNAAANIGLKALLDPDWAGAWWYVPMKVEKGILKLNAEKCKGAECFKDWEYEGLLNQIMGKKDINLWRDIRSQFTDDNWMLYKEYNELTEKKVINILRERAGLEVIK